MEKIKVWIADHLAFAGTLGFVVILGIGWLTLIGPGIGRIGTANRVRVLEQEQQAKISYLQELETLRSNYDELSESDAARIASMIPPEEDIPGLLVTIDALARSNDVAVTGINFSMGDRASAGGPAAIPGVKTVDMNITLEHADYRRFKLFLRDLERNLRLFDVTSASVDPASAAYALSIRTYFSSKPLM